MDWVHCNNCFTLPDAEKAFSLTSCGHIYCRDCKEQCTQGTCKLCKIQCMTIPVSSTMKPDVQIYFTDPDELLKKKLNEVQKVSEFQKGHRARLVAHQRKQLKKFKALRENFGKLLKNLKDVDNERKRLSRENGCLKQYVGMQKNNSGSMHRGEKGHVKSPYDGQTQNIHSGPMHRGEKGHVKSPYDGSGQYSQQSSVMSKFSDKFDDNKSQRSSQRLCVISPPMNGKMGIILNTPSPSTAMRKLNLNSAYTNESLQQSEQFMTPNASPSSTYSNFITPQSISGISPLDTFTPSPPVDHRNKASHYKKDVRKLVVHPYSPND